MTWTQCWRSTSTQAGRRDAALALALIAAAPLYILILTGRFDG
jgi:hypothetical protein